MFYDFFISETYTFVVHIFNALFSKISDKTNELNTHWNIYFSPQGMICIRLNIFFFGSQLLQFSWHIAFSQRFYARVCACLAVELFWAYPIYAFATPFVVISIIIIANMEKMRGNMYASKMDSNPTNNRIHALLLGHDDVRREKKEINLMAPFFSLYIHAIFI